MIGWGWLSLVVFSLLWLGAGPLALETPLPDVRQATTLAALRTGKEALLAYTISQLNLSTSSTVRPGNLPCPDTQNTGYSSNCGSKAALGRLPWRSLDLPPPRDGSGEILWYALSAEFRACSSGCKPLNSQTKGSLKIVDRQGNVLSNDAVFVLFAPGSPLGSQSRSTPTDARQFLEAPQGMSTAHNATPGGPFVYSDPHDAESLFNDQLLWVSSEEFARHLERRVASEVLTRQGQFRHNTLRPGYASQRYPFPANPALAACQSSSYAPALNCLSDSTRCSGILPSADVYPVDKTHPSYWLPSGTPKWLTANLWHQLIRYDISAQGQSSPPAGCPLSLRLQGRAMNLILTFPGQALPAQQFGLPE